MFTGLGKGGGRLHAGEPLAVHFPQGLSSPGCAVSVKLQVRVNSGNEAGSEAVTVKRR